MNIRPVDLQVLIPRTTDVAKTTAIQDHQMETNQQQIAEQFKQSANERQHQVETATQGSHSGRVSTENLDQERRSGQEEAEKKQEQEASTEKNEVLQQQIPPDPLRGRTIDIKT